MQNNMEAKLLAAFRLMDYGDRELLVELAATYAEQRTAKRPVLALVPVPSIVAKSLGAAGMKPSGVHNHGALPIRGGAVQCGKL